ncbi:MCE family protein [Amycolatopsis acidicola]|uniref:MCE family protein n=1 Tax=Amycolatopsis acidicola TaxID=2596893 RepID=A0A5N0V5X1_9PSEU|nr:MCE family protein [Amycolatopsis acidicola]KAA9160481.1 MCE family protein [Amycolatopsis acidicola]
MNATMKTRVYGVGMLGVFALIAALVVAMFNQAFTSTATVTLVADRAGLLMSPKNDVKFHGVVIGEVSDVQLAGDTARLTLHLDPGQVGRLPANATAEISPATAFGNKYVSLVTPPSGGKGVLRPGAVLRADHIGTEVNTVFSNLMAVLNTVHPSQVNTTLNALATTLQGRGEQLGDFLANVDSYLRKLNPELPAVQADLGKTAQVTNLYADVAPDFFHVLDNATKIGATVVDKQGALDGFLKELSSLGISGDQLFTENGANLVQTLDLLEPTSSLLAKYSPELTCFLQGEDYARTLLEPSVGGARPGASTVTNVLPGKEPYQNPANLPQVAAHSGPDCHGLPYLDNAPAPLIKVPGVGIDNPGNADDNKLAVGRSPVQLLLGGGGTAGGSR